MGKVFLTLLALICTGGLTAQWHPRENLRVSPDGISGPDFQVGVNKNGVAFAGFWYTVDEDPERLGVRYSDDLDWAYRLQILDPDGNKVLPDDGLLISDEPSRSAIYGEAKKVFVDSDGNSLYIVKDQRNSANYEEGVFIYKLAPDGKHLWSSPVDLCRSEVFIYIFNLDVTQLADGSYIVAYDVEVTGGRLYTRIERISKAGALRWTEPLVLSNDTRNVAFPRPVADGNDFIIVYSACPVMELSGGPLRAQKFAYDKTPRWNGETLTFYSGGFTTPMPAGGIPDQKGGCFVFWYDDRTFSGYEKAYVAHILADGSLEFITSGGEEGLRISTAPYMKAFRPALCYDPAGEILYAAWEETTSDQSYRSLVIQKISKEGELLWANPALEEGNTHGLVVDEARSPASVGYYSIQTAGEGKIVLFYQHNYTSSGSVENIAVLFDVSGEQPEEIRRIVFTEKGRNRSYLSSSPLFAGEDDSYFLAFWNEAGAVFAHKLPADLLLPEVAPCPVPENLTAEAITANSARLSWTADPANTTWTLSYRNVEPTASWTNVEGLENTAYELAGLTPNTVYLWQVGAHCAETDNESPYAEQQTFTTGGETRIDPAPGSGGSWSVSLSAHGVSIVNPAGEYIEQIRIYALDGRLLHDFAVKASGNILVPLLVDRQALIVEVAGKNGKNVKLSKSQRLGKFSH